MGKAEGEEKSQRLDSAESEQAKDCQRQKRGTLCSAEHDMLCCTRRGPTEEEPGFSAKHGYLTYCCTADGAEL